MYLSIFKIKYTPKAQKNSLFSSEVLLFGTEMYLKFVFQSEESFCVG